MLECVDLTVISDSDFDSRDSFGLKRPKIDDPPELEVIEIEKGEDSNSGSKIKKSDNTTVINVSDSPIVLKPPKKNTITEAPRKNAFSLLMKGAVKSSKMGGVEGLIQYKNFINAEEARLLIYNFENTYKYHTGKSGNYEAVNWGAKVDYTGRKASECNNTPGFLEPIIKKLRDPKAPWASVLRDWIPNEGNITNFIKSRGDRLRDHYDDRLLSGPVIVSIGLLGSGTLTFKSFPRSASQQEIDVGSVSSNSSFDSYLPEFSLQLLFGKARYEYTHGLENRNLHSERRMSLVLRQCKVS